MKVLFFSAAWCGACHGVRPTVVNVCKALGVEMVDVHVDTEPGEHEAISRGVCGLPTIIVLDDDGHETARNEGAVSQSILIGLIKGE